MIFWILLGIVGAVTLFTLFSHWFGPSGDFVGAIGYSILAAIIATVAAVIILFFGFATWMLADPTVKSTHEYSLSALSTNSEIAGRSYFLSGGYVGEKRTLNYIREEGDGGFVLKSVDADYAVVYQDSDTPTVTISYFEQANPWLAPWSFDRGWTAEFHVPEGSILSDYTVTNE